MKQFKRALAMVLVLSMFLGMCPAMAVEPEEDDMLLLNGADVSTWDESDVVVLEEADSEGNQLVYSQTEFEAALTDQAVYEIDIMEGTHIVLNRDIVTDKMIYVDSGASLTVPSAYTLTFKGADGLALEMDSLQEAANYQLPSNIQTDVPVLMMFTEQTVNVSSDVELDAGKRLCIAGSGRLDLDDDVLVTVHNPIYAGVNYFQECIGDDDSLMTLFNPDTEKEVYYLCGSVDVLQAVLDAHPGWDVRQLTIGTVGKNNVLTLVDQADEDAATLFLGDRSVNGLALMCGTRLILAEGVKLTVDKLRMLSYWEPDHTDSILLELKAHSSITVTGDTLIRGNIIYDPTADLDFRGADVTTRYPHLEADWLTMWDSDEAGPLWGESENPQSEIWVTALDEPCLIFYAEYFYNDEWHYEPVIPEIDGVEMWNISDRAARGEYNDWAFVQLAGLNWDREYIASWTAPDDKQVTMPIHVSLPGLGFYADNAISTDHYINELPYNAWDAFNEQGLTVWLGYVDPQRQAEKVEWAIYCDDKPLGTDGYITVGDRDASTGLYPVTIDARAMQENKHFSIHVKYTIENDWVEETWLHVWGETMSIWLDEDRIGNGKPCSMSYTADLGSNQLTLAKDESRTGMLYFVYYNDENSQWVCDPYGPEWFRDDKGLVSVAYQNDSDLLTITGKRFGEGQLMWKNGMMDGDMWCPNDDDGDDGGPLHLKVGGSPVVVTTEEELIARAENGDKELVVVGADMTLTQSLETNDTICMGVNDAEDKGFKLTLGKAVKVHTTGGVELVVESEAELMYALSDNVTSVEDKYIFVRGTFTLGEMVIPQGTRVLLMQGGNLQVAEGAKVTIRNGFNGLDHVNLVGQDAIPLHAKYSVFADATYYKADQDGNWTDACRVLYGDEATMAADLAAKATDGWSVWNLILSAANGENAPGVVELKSDLADIFLDYLMVQDGSQLVLHAGAVIRTGYLFVAQNWENHATRGDTLLVVEDGAVLLANGGYVQGNGQWTGQTTVSLGEIEFQGHWPHLVAQWVYWDAENKSWQIAGNYEGQIFAIPNETLHLAFSTAVWNEGQNAYTYAPIAAEGTINTWSPSGKKATLSVLEEGTHYRQVEMDEFGTYAAVYSDGSTFSGSMPLTSGLPELGFFREPERNFDDYLGANGTEFRYGEDGSWSNEFYIDLAGEASFEITHWWTDEDQDWYHIEDLGNQMWKVVLHDNFISDSEMCGDVYFGYTMQSKDGSWDDRNGEIIATVLNTASGVSDAESLVRAVQSGVDTVRLSGNITLSASDLPEEMNGTLRLNTVKLLDKAKLVLEEGVVLQVDALYAVDSDINYEKMSEYERQQVSELLVDVRSGATLEVRNDVNVDGHLNWAADATVRFDCDIQAAGYWPRLEHTWLDGTENGFAERKPTDYENSNNDGKLLYDYNDWHECNTSREENRIFFLRYFDGTNWTQVPVTPTFTIDGEDAPDDFKASLEKEAVEGQTNAEHFVRYSLPDWNKTYTATATAAGYTLSTSFHTALSDVGFYSQPEVNEEYALNELALSPVADNVFYMGFDINADQTYYVGDVQLNNFTMAEDDDLITMTKLDNGMYKVTIPAAKARDLGNNGTQAEFSVTMTHGVPEERWTHDYSIGISTHNAVVFSASTHFTEAALLTDSLLANLKTKITLGTGESVTGSLYQVEYRKNENNPGWYVNPFDANWFRDGNDNGSFEDAGNGKTTIIASSVGLYQIYRADAVPDAGNGYKPGANCDWSTLPLDVVVTSDNPGNPYLTMGWLWEHWDWDESAEENVPSYTEDRMSGNNEGFTITPGQVFKLIFYIHYYDAETGRWATEPVSVERRGDSSVELVNLSKYAAAGQVNGDRFVAVDASEAAWGDSITLVGTSAVDSSISAEMTVNVALPGHGFYTAPKMTEDNYLLEYQLDPLTRDYVVYFGCINEGETLSIDDYDKQNVKVEPVENVPNLYKITLSADLAQLPHWEDYWSTIYWTTSGVGENGVEYSYRGDSGLRCYMPETVEVTSEAQLKSAADSGVREIILVNDITLNSEVVIREKDLNVNGHTLTLSDNGVLTVDRLPEIGGEGQRDIETVLQQIACVGAVWYDNGEICWYSSVEQMKGDILSRDSAPRQLIMDDSTEQQTLVIDSGWPELNLECLILNNGWSLEITGDGVQVHTDRLLVYPADPDQFDSEKDATLRIQVSKNAYLGVHRMARVWGHINWVSGGHIDLPEDTKQWGQMPELVFYWLDCNEKGWYIRENERNDGFGSAPVDIHRAVFFAKVWKNNQWVEQPVHAYDGMNRVTIFRSLYDYEEDVRFANLDDPANDYFVVLDCNYAGWEENRTIFADVAGTYVEMNAYFGYGDCGFFSKNKAAPENYINSYTMTRDGENSFYFIFDSDHEQLEGVYNLTFDENGNEVSGKLPGWDKVTVTSTEDPNVYKITINDDVDRMKHFDFALFFKTYQLDENGNIAVDDQGQQIIHGRHHMWIGVEAAELGETLALLQINNQDYRVTENGVVVYRENDRIVKNTLGEFFNHKVEYDLQTNTLILNNAELSKLELGYNWGDTTALPNEELRIQVNGTNTITNTEDHAVILHGGIKAIFQGTGTLNIAVNNADDPEKTDDNHTFDAFVVNRSQLVLNEGVTVNIQASGVGYQYHDPAYGNPENTTGWNSEDGYFYENSEKATCYIRALSSHEGGATLYVQEGAKLTTDVPAVGAYMGIEGFDSIVVRDEPSALTTQRIHFYGENKDLSVYHGASVTVTGVEEHDVGVDDQGHSYNNYNINTISMDNGSVKVYDGGKLTVKTGGYSKSDPYANYHVSGISINEGGFRMDGSAVVTINLTESDGWADGLYVGNGEILINDGTLDVDIKQGIAVVAGNDRNSTPTVLNHNGGTVEINTGEQVSDATAYRIAYGSTANFTGTSVNNIRAFRALFNAGTVNFRESTQFNAEATTWASGDGLVVNENVWSVRGRSSTMNVFGGTLNLTNSSGLTGRKDDDGQDITVFSVLNNHNDFVMTGGVLNVSACENVFAGINCSGTNLISGGTVNIDSAEGNRPRVGINVSFERELSNNYFRLTGGTINSHGELRGALIQANTYLQGGSFNATAYENGGSIGFLILPGNDSDAGVTVVGGEHIFKAPETQYSVGLYSAMVPIVISGGSVTAEGENAVVSYYEENGDHQDDSAFYNMFTLASGIHAVSNTSGLELKFSEKTALRPDNNSVTYYEAWLEDSNEGSDDKNAKFVTFSATPGTQAPEEPEPTPETVVLSDLEVTSSRMTVGAPVSIRASVTVEKGGTITFTLPKALKLVENSVAVNNVITTYTEAENAKKETTFTLAAEGAAVITFQVIPQQEGIFTVYGLVTENETNKTSNCSTMLSVSGFKMTAPTYTNAATIQVSGAAQKDLQVILSVRYKNANGQDSTKTFSGMVSALGTYAINVTLPIIDPLVAQTFTIDAYLHSEEGQFQAGSTTVVYNPQICEIKYLDITNQIHGNSTGDVLDVNNRIDFTSGTGVPDRSFYTYWPELNKFDFKATFSDPGAWKIDWVRVDVTYRNGGCSSFDLENVSSGVTELAETGQDVVWAIKDAEVANAPVDFSVVYACSLDASDPIIIDPGVVPIMPIMDPSGTVTMNGIPVEGATVTIYYGGDGDTPNEELAGKAYDTTNIMQVNPQVTDASGGFHWDVPEGWWKVVAEKDGQRIETDWLSVMPVRTSLILEFPLDVQVKAGTEFVQSAAMKIPVDISFTTGTSLQPVVVAAIYDADGKFISMDMQPVTQAGEVTLTVDNSKGEAAEIRTFLVNDLISFTPVSLSRSYLKQQ